jgi:hypothetical protein
MSGGRDNLPNFYRKNLRHLAELAQGRKQDHLKETLNNFPAFLL